MNIVENFPLREHNTFGIPVYTKFFAEVCAVEEFIDVCRHTDLLKNHHLILGGGSNVLFTNDFDGTVIKIATRGMKIIDEDTHHVWLKVSAGENWDELVAWSVRQSWGGLENLSLIPGQVGSSPIQNIGAYGVELKDHFDSLEAYHKESGHIRTFTNEDCQFGYRDSYFKREGRNRYIILSVTFKLDKNPVIKSSYAALSAELDKNGICHPDIQDVRDAVINVRQSKLPDPETIGNAGSFFKNPVIPESLFRNISQKYPDLVSYPDRNGIKIAAGWLIEKSGWKGYREGDAGVHEKQALVLVNHGHATGKEILNLAGKIIESVKAKFDIDLEAEVNIL